MFIWVAVTTPKGQIEFSYTINAAKQIRKDLLTMSLSSIVICDVSSGRGISFSSVTPTISKSSSVLSIFNLSDSVFLTVSGLSGRGIPGEFICAGADLGSGGDFGEGGGDFGAGGGDFGGGGGVSGGGGGGWGASSGSGGTEGNSTISVNQ